MRTKIYYILYRPSRNNKTFEIHIKYYIINCFMTLRYNIVRVAVSIYINYSNNNNKKKKDTSGKNQ